MEMEVVVPVPAVDFNFDSTCSSPYITAPSSPQRFGNLFFSAPASPSRASSSLCKDDVSTVSGSASTVPFEWEKNPGSPKTRENRKVDDDEEDFEFNFSGQLERTSLSAEELFDGGKIRPLKPPPGYDTASTLSSPRSPKSRTSQEKDFDPLVAAMEETSKRGESDHQEKDQKQKQEQQHQKRGRERMPSSSSGYVHKGSRSLSPLRVSDIILEHEQISQAANIVSSPTGSNTKSYAASILSAISFSPKGYRKWRLKDLLLFRSASEGRATSKDPLKKYTMLSKKEAEDVKNASFRSTESVGSASSSRRRGPISPHELHYTANRAVSEEMKRKTFLPYKQGLLGCLGFNPGVHEISRGVGSLTRG